MTIGKETTYFGGRFSQVTYFEPGNTINVVVPIEIDPPLEHQIVVVDDNTLSVLTDIHGNKTFQTFIGEEINQLELAVTNIKFHEKLARKRTHLFWESDGPDEVDDNATELLHQKPFHLLRPQLNF